MKNAVRGAIVAVLLLLSAGVRAQDNEELFNSFKRHVEQVYKVKFLQYLNAGQYETVVDNLYTNAGIYGYALEQQLARLRRESPEYQQLLALEPMILKQFDTLALENGSRVGMTAAQIEALVNRLHTAYYAANAGWLDDHLAAVTGVQPGAAPLFPERNDGAMPNPVDVVPVQPRPQQPTEQTNNASYADTIVGRWALAPPPRSSAGYVQDPLSILIRRVSDDPVHPRYEAEIAEAGKYYRDQGHYAGETFMRIEFQMFNRNTNQLVYTCQILQRTGSGEGSFLQPLTLVYKEDTGEMTYNNFSNWRRQN